MSVEIQFLANENGKARLVDFFQMQGDGRSWTLPELVLAPVKSLPHILSVVVKVTGTPPAVAVRVQNRYTARSFSDPLKLGERRGFGGVRADDVGPLPADVACELQVAVTYRDSDGRGNPVGDDLVVTKACRLVSGGVGPLPPELTVKPTQATVTLGEPASINIEVRNPVSSNPPVCRLEFPDTVLVPEDPVAQKLPAVLPELRDALLKALQVSPVRQEQRGTTDVYTAGFTLRTSQAVRNALQTVTDPVLVPLVIEQKGCTKSAGAILKLEVREAQFDGWVVIDFGTSNSTVTVSEVRPEREVTGFPPEQERVLRDEIGRLFRASVGELFPGAQKFETPWKQLLTRVADRTRMPDAESLAAEVHRLSDARFYEVLAAFEVALQGAHPAEFRRGLMKRLHDATHSALLEPTLSRDFVYPVNVNLTREEPVVESEMKVEEITEFGKGDLMARVSMGEEVRSQKFELIATGTAPDAELLSRFLPSPKRHFGTDHPPFQIALAGRTWSVSVDQLMRGGWKCLLDMTSKVQAQDPDFLSKGPFREVVITYPTVAPPSVRRRIPELLGELGLSSIRTDYDEAIAAAIFYMLREYTGAREVGLEAFKARSRLVDPVAGTWAQNVLVLDIGGGTTDIALIRLTLSEEAAFEPNEDRGAGGRYYKITPKLLSSTGNTRLGGELMTLRLFRLLKAMFADRLLQAVQDNKVRLEPIKTLLATGLPGEAKDAKGDRYRADPKTRRGWLSEQLDPQQAESPNRSEVTLALNLAERVLPTRWAGGSENRAARLQAFYTLWEIAEEAKRKLGSRTPEGPTRYPIKADKIHELLAQCYPGAELPGADSMKDLSIDLSVTQMERTIRPVVDDAVRYATGALEQLPADDKVDWLILSGQSSHLNLVRQEIRREFQSNNRFVWNPERVTFVPKYAKLSTSIGACLAEHYRRRGPHPKRSKDTLRRGVNMLQFDIDNLFYNLPCTFNAVEAQASRRVLTVGSELLELSAPQPGQEIRGKARSEWLGALIDTTLTRADFKEATPIPWGTFKASALIGDTLRIPEKEWSANYRLQFEIDHRLSVDVLVSRFAEGFSDPDYVLTSEERAQEPRTDLRPVWTKLADKFAKAVAAKVPEAAPGAPPPKVPDALPPLFGPRDDGRKTLAWQVSRFDPVGNVTVGKPLFSPDAQRWVRFHFPEPDTRVKLGLLSNEVLEQTLDSGKLYLALTHPNLKGVVPLPPLDFPEPAPQFRRKCRLSLDEDGVIRVHTGEPGYWETGDPRDLVGQTGRVYRRTLEPTTPQADEEINPFSGLH